MNDFTVTIQTKITYKKDWFLIFLNFVLFQWVFLRLVKVDIFGEKMYGFIFTLPLTLWSNFNQYYCKVDVILPEK